jgi:hypothetical protein
MLMYTLCVGSQISLCKGGREGPQMWAEQLRGQLRLASLGQHERGGVRQQLLEGLLVLGVVQRPGQLHGHPPAPFGCHTTLG